MMAETGLSDSVKDSNQFSPDPESSVKKKTKHSSLKKFMLALSFTFVCKSLAGSLMKSVIPQIERRFEITSSKAALIDTSFEIGNLLVITLVSHFGAKSHIPRIIGTGCLIMTIGSFLTASPHFFMGYYRYESPSKSTLENSTIVYSPCSTVLNSTDNKKSSVLLESGCKNESGLPMWIYVLLGNMLRGIGESPITPLGISFVDNSAKEGHSSFFMGIFHSISMIGTVFGFLLGSLCAKLYVDIGYVDLSTITIKPTDSRWVGAWWLGFLIVGIINFIAGMPFFFIPKSLDRPVKQRKISASLDVPTTKNESRSQRMNLKNPGQIEEPKHLSGFFHSLKRLLCNKIYFIFITLSLLHFSSFIGFFSHAAKYAEQQFDQSMSKSNFIVAITLPIISLSILLGGYIPQKFKLDIVGMTKLYCISQILGFFFKAVAFFFICERPVAGLTVAYNGNDTQTHLENVPFSFCNSDCNCNANQWDPVCGDDGLTYISPCLAGCKSSAGQGKNLVFHNCSCVEANNFQASKTSAHLGNCPRTEDCSRMFIYYAVFQCLSSSTTAIGIPLATVLILGTVEPELKSLAMGLYLLVIRSFGGISAPIYFGLAIDSTCLKWSINNCGDQGACRIYDSVSLRNILFGLSLGLKALACTLGFFFLMMIKKKYKEKNIGHSNKGKMDVDETNLKEPLKYNKKLVTSAHEDRETHM